MRRQTAINITGGVLIILLIVIVALAYSIIQDQERTIETQRQRPIMLYENTEDTQAIGFRIFDLINITRETRGLPELEYSPLLSKAGYNHAKDLLEFNYWQHDRDGKRFSDFAKELGIEYKQVAENLARDQRTAGEVIDDWLKSESHKATLLGDYKMAGVGVIKKDNGALIVSSYFTN